jgi:hypothetical protein
MLRHSALSTQADAYILKSAPESVVVATERQLPVSMQPPPAQTWPGSDQHDACDPDVPIKLSLQPVLRSGALLRQPDAAWTRILHDWSQLPRGSSIKQLAAFKADFNKVLHAANATCEQDCRLHICSVSGRTTGLQTCTVPTLCCTRESAAPIVRQALETFKVRESSGSASMKQAVCAAVDDWPQSAASDSSWTTRD